MYGYIVNWHNFTAKPTLESLAGALTSPDRVYGRLWA